MRDAFPHGMRELNPSRRAELDGMFADRVSYHPTERRLYGHDVGVMPRRLRPLLGNTTPSGVVQPESEAELIELCRSRPARRPRRAMAASFRSTAASWSTYGG
jgi:hypothetical protein